MLDVAGIRATWGVGGLALLASGCALGPEIAVEHALEDAVIIRRVHTDGCFWPDELAPGEVTSPCGTLGLGDGRIRFERFDARFPAGRPGGVGPASDEGAAPEADTPRFFSFRTREPVLFEAGDFARIVLRPEDVEEDFEAPDRKSVV